MTTTRTTARPAWLSADIDIPDELVEHIHAHAERAEEVIMPLLEWLKVSSELWNQFERAISGTGLCDLDDAGHVLGDWTGLNRTGAAELIVQNVMSALIDSREPWEEREDLQKELDDLRADIAAMHATRLAVAVSEMRQQ